MDKPLTLISCCAAALALASCQNTDVRAAARTAPDAVTSIHQVDPAYREYFRAQQGAPFSMSEQRAAFAQARAGVRTPVPTVAPVAAETPRLASRRTTTNSRRALAVSRTTAKKGKAGKTSARTAVAKNTGKKAAAKKKTKALASAGNRSKQRRKG